MATDLYQQLDEVVGGRLFYAAAMDTVRIASAMELGHGPPPASSTPHERLRPPTSCPAVADLGCLHLLGSWILHSDRILDACACTAGGEDEWVMLDLGRLRRIW